MKTKIVRNQMGEYQIMIKTWRSLGWDRAYYYEYDSGGTYLFFPLNDYSTQIACDKSLVKILEILDAVKKTEEKDLKKQQWTEIPDMTVEQGKEFEKCLKEIS